MRVLLVDEAVASRKISVQLIFNSTMTHDALNLNIYDFSLIRDRAKDVLVIKANKRREGENNIN